MECLGPLRVLTTTGAEIELGGTLERRVLAALVLRAGDVVPLDMLADALFGEQPTTGAKIRLQNHVSRLRRRLGTAALITTAPGYRLDVDVDAVEVDWRRFEELVAKAGSTSDPARTMELYAKALSLWRGAPFGELEDWLPARAAAGRLEELRRVAEEEHARALVTVGRFSEAVSRLEALVIEEPLRERRWAALMLALSRAARQADAQRAFQRARCELAEVGLEPGPELKALERAISVQDPALAFDASAVVRGSDPTPTSTASGPTNALVLEPLSNLPCSVDVFVGRQNDLVRLAACLETHHLVTVLGPGGMGKTRLSLEAARRSNGFVDGTWLVQLGSIPAGGNVARAVATTLGLSIAAGHDVSDTVVDWCERFEGLVILDNCEHVLDGAAHLAASVLERGPAATLLATSRAPLSVAGEHVVPLGPLPLDAVGDGRPEAVELLVERITAMRPGFDPAAPGPVLAEICARLDGMPLAIELAAARLRTLSPAEVADRLDQRFRLLTGGRRAVIERHRTLRATVDWSYDLLDTGQQRLFERLAVFAGPFGLDDVAAIGTDPMGSGLMEGPKPDREHDDEVVDLLAELADRSLVAVSETEPAYRLLETLRAYGLERLQAQGVLADIRHLHAAWFGAKATRTRLDACGPAEHHVWQLAVAQLPDYQAASTWALEHGDFELAVGMPADLTEAFWLRNAIEFAPWGGLLAAKVESPDTVTQARALWLVGCYQQVVLGDLVASREALDAAVGLDPDSAFCHLQLSIQGALTSDLELWRDHASRALAVSDGDPAALASAYVMLGGAADLAGRVDDTRRCADDLLRLATQRGWAGAIGYARYLLARVAAQRSPRRAEHELREALRLARSVESYALTTAAQIELIRVLTDDKPEAAVTALVDLLGENRRRLERLHLPQALSQAVVLLEATGDRETASTIARALEDWMVAAGPSRTGYDRAVAVLRSECPEQFNDAAGPSNLLDLADLAIAPLTR